VLVGRQQSEQNRECIFGQIGLTALSLPGTASSIFGYQAAYASWKALNAVQVGYDSRQLNELHHGIITAAAL
jgi:hypothetical protein